VNKRHINGKPTPEYTCWLNMRARCRNPNHPEFKNYGARGIVVCDRWSSFDNFVEDMGLRPSSNHSIERLNNDKPYSSENCVWLESKYQARNQRKTRKVELDGEVVSLSEAAEKLGVRPATLLNRTRYGRTLQEAITGPLRVGPAARTFVTVGDKQFTLRQLSEMSGRSPQFLRLRIVKKGQTYEEAIST